VFARSNSTSDGLTDLTRSNHDDHVTHCSALSAVRSLGVEDVSGNAVLETPLATDAALQVRGIAVTFHFDLRQGILDVAKIIGCQLDVRRSDVFDSGLADIVADRFDAGVRLGEAIARDMIAVRIGPDLRMAVVGSPSYLAAHPAPQVPQDLATHKCVKLRLPTAGGLYAWELERESREVRVRVDGQLAFNDPTMIVRATVAGFGLGFVLEDLVAPNLADGSLIRVLEDWCPPFAGYHLYYTSRRERSAAFALLVDALRYRG
jgi:hypothetical protein